MGTILFIILHFLGHTEGPDEWYTVVKLLSLDSIFASVLIVAYYLKKHLDFKRSGSV